MQTVRACAFAGALPLLGLSCSDAKTEPFGRRSEALATIAALSDFAPHVRPHDRLARIPGGLALVDAPSAWRPLRGIEAVLPAQAGEPLRIARPGRPGLWIELSGDSNRAASTSVHGNAVVHELAGRDTDVVFLAEPDRVEEIRLLRTGNAPRTFAYRVTLGPGVGEIRTSGDTIEVTDREGRVAMQTEPLFAVDVTGRQAPLHASVEGDLLEIALPDAECLAYPIAIDPAWTSAGTMATARAGHGYGMVAGRVLVAGGRGNAGLLGATARWEPGLAWSAGPSLTVAREGQTVTEVDGVVVVAGGTSGSGVLSSVEVFTSASAGPSMPLTTRRTKHATASIGSGKLLVVGGVGTSGLLSSAEIGSSFSGGSGTPSWTAAASLPAPRANATATALGGGRVLVVGGECDVSGNACPQAWIYDSSTNAWSSAGSMSTPRSRHAAALLTTGKVLVAGGQTSSTGGPLSTAEIYNPTSNSWTTVGSMSVPRRSFALHEIAGGRVLAAGGASTAATEMYDGNSKMWEPAGSMAAARDEAIGYAFGGAPRSVLVAGGLVGGSPTSAAEVFALLPNGSACTFSAECASRCCVASVCGACADAGVDADAATDADSSADTSVVDSAPDTSVIDSAPDTSVIDSAPDTSVIDSAPDTSVVDSTMSDSAGEDSAPTPDAPAPIDSGGGEDAGLCSSNDQCAPEQWCDQGRCVPRSERPDLGCACSIVGGPQASLLVEGVASLVVLALLRRRRRGGR